MMPPLMSGQEGMEWLRLSKEFHRSCEDAEPASAREAGSAIISCIVMVLEPEEAIDALDYARKIVERRQTVRQMSRDNIKQLWEDDDL